MNRTFPARPFAAAWINVFLAAAEDDERPMLHRSVHIEFLPDDVRLFATDTYMALWSCPGESTDDVLPTETVIAIDSDKRALALMKFAFTDAKDDAEALVTVSTAQAADVSLTNELFARNVLCLAYKGERVALSIFEGEPLNWRSLVSNRKPKASSTLALSPWLLGRFGSLKSCTDVSAAVEMHLAGALGPALFSVGVSPELAGVLMPVRASTGEVEAVA